MRIKNNPEISVIRRTTDVTKKQAPLGPEGFPLRLRQLRERGDVLMREQDKLAGLTVGHSQHFEAGRNGSRVSARTVAQLARVYGTTMEWLYLGVGEPPSQPHLEKSVAQAFARYEDAEDKCDKIMDKLKVIW